MKNCKTVAHGHDVALILGGRSNVYVVRGRGRAILVDSGPPACHAALATALDRAGIARLDALILTHAHYDHAGAAAFIRREFWAKVLVHSAERDVLASGRNDTDAMIPRGTNAFTQFVGRFLVPLWVPRVEFEPCVPDVPIDDRLDLAPFGVDGYVIHTPGHSPGSVCVIVDGEIALCGDTVFGAIPGTAMPPWAWRHDLMLRNWNSLLETGCGTFLPGHGSPRTREDLLRSINRRRGSCGNPGEASSNGGRLS